MKAIKKLMAVVLALLMVSALAVSAFAMESPAAPTTSITIKSKADDGETYNVYKMFDLEVSDDLTKFSYKIATAWASFFGEGGAGASYVEVNEDGYVSLVENPDVAALAQAAAAFAANLTATATATLADCVAEVKDIPNGYYLITSSVGTVAMIDTTPTNPNPEIDDKNPLPSVEKVVAEGGDNAQIGDTVDFTITVTAQKGAKNYVVHDTMDDGLTLDTTKGFTVKVGDTALTAGSDKDYVVSTGTNGYTFEITFNKSYLDTITAETDIVITYSATLNANAVVGTAEENTVKLTYGDNSSVDTEDSSTKTFTHKFAVHKYDANDSDANLAGAEFKLMDGDKVVKLVAVAGSTNEFRVALPTESASETFTTVEGANIVINGVDSDEEDHSYTLVEVNAPQGFNKLTEAVEVSVSADDDSVIEIANNSGTELPSTGGIGTVLFITLGAIVFAATAIVLVTKKRLYNEG